MYRRLIYVFIFAILVAGAASFLVYRLILGAAPNANKTGTAKAVIATRTMQVGELIREGDVKDVSWSDPLPDEYVKTAADAVGRGAITTIYKNELLLDGRLAARGAGAGLAAIIPTGMRAVALRVNEVIGLAGFVQPGMRVDVIVAGNSPMAQNGRYGTLSRTVLQNIEVLSSGQKIEKAADGKPDSAQVVNLLVTPDQAETLSLAGSETKVQLVLRNPLDTEEVVTKGTSVAGLFGEATPLKTVSTYRPAPKPSPPPAPKPRTIEIFNGPKRTSQSMDSSSKDLP